MLLIMLLENEQRNMTPNKIFVSKDLFRWSFNEPAEKTDIEYVRKEAVSSIIRDYLENWLDTYKIERLIEKIEEL